MACARLRAVMSRLRALPILLSLTGFLGLVTVLVVPAGLPYDEPSHWLNVLFCAERGQMSELGEAGVSYEAQRGPVAYVLRALIYLPVEWVTRERAAFLAVRLVGVAEFDAFLWLLRSVLGRVLPRHSGPLLLGIGVLALNPMLLVIAGSVQNDTANLALAIGGPRRRPGW